MTEPLDISVSIVSYNTRDLLRACLASLLARQAAGEASLEIIVADNGSTDGSVEMVATEFPTVQIIPTGGNIGYGRANNVALAQARGRYFLVLNSDTEVEAGALRAMRDFLDTHPEAGAVGAQLILPDGKIQPSCGIDPNLLAVVCSQTYLSRLFPRNRITGGYLMTYWDYDERREVAQICGACLCVRREVYQQINGFDPAYFMYYEDTDFCIRLRRAGWRIYYLPEARVRHHWAASSRDWRSRARMLASFNKSQYYFFSRYKGRLQAYLFKLIVLLGVSARVVLWGFGSLVNSGAREKVRGWREIWAQTWRMSPKGEYPGS